MFITKVGLLLALQTCAGLQVPTTGLRRAAASSRSPTPLMPIGVPKVAYKVPGAQYADWVSCGRIRTEPQERGGTRWR